MVNALSPPLEELDERGAIHQRCQPARAKAFHQRGVLTLWWGGRPHPPGERPGWGG